MRVLIFLSVFSMWLHAVSLSDFEPLIKKIAKENDRLEKLESNKNSKQNMESNIDSKEFANSPQVKLVELTKKYQKEHFNFTAKLENIAQTKEQKDFIDAYLAIQRIIILNAITSFYLKPSDGWFSDNKPKDKDDLKALEKALSEFFASQKDMLENEEFFNIFDNYTRQKPCTEASCGHINEIFIIRNAIDKYKTNKEIDRLKEIATEGGSGYRNYLLLMSMESGDFDKMLHFNDLLKLNPSKKQMQEFIADFDYEKGGKYLNNFGDFLAYNYLSKLYATKYALAVATKEMSASEALKKVNICVFNTMDDKIKKLCKDEGEGYLDYIIDNLALTQKPQYLTFYTSPCLKISYKDNTTSLDLEIKAIATNISPICEAAIKKAKSVNKSFKLESSLTNLKLTKEQEQYLSLLPHFKEYLRVKENKERVKSLCLDNNNPFACNAYGREAKDMKLIQSSCNMGVENACVFLGYEYFRGNNKNLNEFIKIANTACNLNNGEFCWHLGRVYASNAKQREKILKNEKLDFRSIKQDLKKGYEYYKKALNIEDSKSLGAKGIIESSDEFIRLGYESKESIEKLEFIHCNSINFATESCQKFVSKEYWDLTARAYDKQNPLNKEEIKKLETYCEKKMSMACDKLQIAYSNHEELDNEENFNKRRMFSCEAGEELSCLGVGRWLIDSDLAKSLELKIKSCNLSKDGHIPFNIAANPACKEVGDAYKLGLGTARSEEIANYYYMKGCMKHDKEACNILLED